MKFGQVQIVLNSDFWRKNCCILREASYQFIPSIKQALGEAARYTLLRRLAPALRHNLAGALQPVSMLSSLLEKRLQKPDPGLAALAEKSVQLSISARDGAKACMDLMAWLSPQVGDSVSLGSGVEEAAHLVTTELFFKGFNVVNQINDLDVQIALSLTRNVFLAALIALTDSAKAPADLLLNASLIGSYLVLTVTLNPVLGEPPPFEPASYRDLVWADVLALAEPETVALSYTDHTVQLRWPLRHQCLTAEAYKDAIGKDVDLAC